jgi:hypothetical protein
MQSQRSLRLRRTMILMMTRRPAVEVEVEVEAEVQRLR